MKETLLKPLVASAFLAASLNCASIGNGRFEHVDVDATPAGTDVNVVCDGARVDSGVTPARIRIRRKSDGCELRLAHEGYESATVPLVRGIAPMYWGNLAVVAAIIPAVAAASQGGIGSGAASAAFGAISVLGAGGLLLDKRNGAMYRHSPARIEVKLQRK